MVKPELLIVDDDRDTCEVVRAVLKLRGFDVAYTTTAAQALALLEARNFSAVITDLTMQGVDGLELCRRISQVRPDVPVVVMTGFASLETVTGAIRAGAYDFIAKPFEMAQLVETMQRAVKHRTLGVELAALKTAARTAAGTEPMIGTTEAMQRARNFVEHASESEAPVLIRGETGTGKELLAREVHAKSRRGAGPFVVVSCAAPPEGFLDTPLAGGTLFLDELGDLSPAMQAKLLAALDKQLPFDMRVIAATRKNLDRAVEKDRFRSDLLYRINVLSVELPSLRDRKGDILVLAQHFIERSARENSKAVSGMSSAVAERLLEYPWPGNVSELMSTMTRAVAVADFEQLILNDLPEVLRTGKVPVKPQASYDPREMPTFDEVEHVYVEHVLEAVGGNKTRAAEVLGFDRKTLYRKLHRYERERMRTGAGPGSAPSAAAVMAAKALSPIAS